MFPSRGFYHSKPCVHYWMSVIKFCVLFSLWISDPTSGIRAWVLKDELEALPGACCWLRSFVWSLLLIAEMLRREGWLLVLNMETKAWQREEGVCCLDWKFNAAFVFWRTLTVEGVSCVWNLMLPLSLEYGNFFLSKDIKNLDIKIYIYI